MHQSWKLQLDPEFEKPYMKELKAFLKSEYKKGKTIYPKGAHYFRALELTPYDDVKVVLLGQDPYHGPGQAHGLCFSVPDGVPPPPSLVNIFKELRSDLKDTGTRPANLEDWAQQGVLLLNTVLTVEARQPASHQNRGWENFTDKILSLLNANKEHLVFVLWGSHAQKKGAFLNRKKHLVLESSHPSPLSSYRGFFGSKPFSTINAYLIEKKKTPIQWTAHHRSLGFTLLEMLITITILATLMVYTTKNIQTAIKTKAKLQKQLDDMSQVRDALKIMEKDINLAFHYRDMEKEINNSIKTELQKNSSIQNQGQQTGSQNQNSYPPANISDYFEFKKDEINEKTNRVDPTTHFLGKENELYFITLNSGKIYESALLADFVKVGYKTKNCKNSKGEESQCLVRFQSAIAEGEIDKGGAETVLLENVSDFALKYFVKKPDWEESWDSRTPDTTKKDIFPLAVQITLSTEQSNSAGNSEESSESPKKKITMNLVARVRFPNNSTGSTPTSASSEAVPTPTPLQGL